jgi:ABC-type glutathione transport system ATPase component
MGGEYTGHLQNGIPNGHGRLLLPNGTGYDGEWRNGKPHGRGTITYKSGASYEGNLVNGKQHGSGVYIRKDGSKASGIWENGKLVKADKLPEPGRPPARVRRDGGPAINVDNLSHWYGNLQAVREISFNVYPGEILGFLGPNGAGKSTTIKVLTGQLPLKGGSAQILGREIGRDDPKIQSQIGVSFEEKNLYLEMTALENLDFFA